VRYRVRARRAKASRYRYDLDAMNRAGFAGGWSAAEYQALRDELLRKAIRLDLETPFWEHEPGIPDHLRVDWLGPLTTLSPSVPEYQAAELAYSATLARRRAWLANHHDLIEAGEPS